MTGNGLTIRNRARFADYDKFYQNSYPGAVSADGSQVALAAYNQGPNRIAALQAIQATLPMDYPERVLSALTERN